jgi:hypothetical protein
MIKENFDRIKGEVAQIVKAEMKRIVGDPDLKSRIVKK